MNFKNNIPEYVLEVLDAISNDGHEAYVVGGAVRDLIIGRTPTDFDLTTSGTPEETIISLEKNNIRYVDNARKHGTIMAIVQKQKIEITTFRIDGEYLDNRRPDSVQFTRNIEEDVKRRDFTINALYLDKDGNVVDLVGGIDDIKNHLIRSVGDPEKRFSEDALRILRGLRFSSELGFAIEDNTFLSMNHKKDLLKNISGERIQVEFSKLIVASNASSVVRKSVDIISVFVPELKACEKFDQRSKYHNLDVLEHMLKVLDGIDIDSSKRDEALAIAAVFHDIAKPICFYMEDGSGHMDGHPEVGSKIMDRVLSKLRYSNEIRNEVTKLILYHDTFVKLDRYSVHKFISQNGIEFQKRLEILQRADILAHSQIGQGRLNKLQKIIEIREELEKNNAVFKMQDLCLSGNDIINLGVKPGPEIGYVMNKLFDDYMRGAVSNDKDELLKLAQRHLTSC